MHAVLAYVVARLKEPSSWRGIVLVATAAGLTLSPAQWEAIITAGLALAGVIGVAFPDAKPAADVGADAGV